jgi:hypothetical protein
LTTESGSLARIGPAGGRVKQDIIPDPPHPRDGRKDGVLPVTLIDVGDEFAITYEHDDDDDGWMYVHKALEGFVHAVHRDGDDLVVLVVENSWRDPKDYRFFVYKPEVWETCEWDSYDEGWRDRQADEGWDEGSRFGSTKAEYKGEENVPTEWWVIKD